MAALLAGACFSADSLLADGGRPAAKNLAVIQLLAERAAEEVALSFPPRDTGFVLLTIAPRDYGWTLELEIERVFDRQNYRVVSAAESAQVVVDLGIDDAGVVYRNPRRDGFFGSRILDRTVRLKLVAKVTDAERKSVLLMKEISRQDSDVVQLDEVDQLQTPGIPMTRGEPPPQGVFDTWLEPLILLGAIAVGIYLLFTMRS
jgi:hypothetical protein